MACRSCNSSKGALDFLEWVLNVWDFPPMAMLRRYLKLAITYCADHDLLDVTLHKVDELDPPLPFAIEHLPAIVRMLQDYGSEPQQTEEDTRPTLFDGLEE
jgi:hypothetical protein